MEKNNRCRDLWRNFRQRGGFNRPCRSAIKLKKGLGALTDEQEEAFEEMMGEKIPTDEYEDEYEEWHEPPTSYKWIVPWEKESS